MCVRERERPRQRKRAEAKHKSVFHFLNYYNLLRIVIVIEFVE